MLTKPSLSEKIIRSLSVLEEYFYLPKSESQFFNWFHNYGYRKQKRKKAHEKRMRKRVLEGLKRLEKANILSYSQDQSYQLTPRGWLRYLYYYSRYKPRFRKEITKKSQKKYLIIFDIPEEHRSFRDLFRKSLKNQGCRMLQKSVFICPHKGVFVWAKHLTVNCELDGHVLFIQAVSLD